MEEHIKIPELRNLYRKLEQFPDLIAEKERKIYKTANEIEDLHYQSNKIEQAIKVDIYLEKDKELKKVFTNQELRDAELTKRLFSNESYLALKEKIGVKGVIKKGEEIDLKRLYNELKIRRTQVQIWEISKDLK